MEGWNDPPTLTNKPVAGNLKINLNKRVAFPLSVSTTKNEPTLIVLPSIPTSGITENSPGDDSESNELNESLEIDLQKEKVLYILRKGVENISSSSVQSTVAVKLKSLEDDWNHCDLETKKLLVQLIDHIDKCDTKNAFAIQRDIVLKGHNRQPWVLAIRQIIMNMEPTKEDSGVPNEHENFQSPNQI